MLPLHVYVEPGVQSVSCPFIALIMAQGLLRDSKRCSDQEIVIPLLLLQALTRSIGAFGRVAATHVFVG